MKLFMIVLFIFIKGLTAHSQPKFIEVPLEIQTNFNVMVQFLKNNPPAFYINLYNTDSYKRKTFLDSTAIVLSQYKSSCIQKFYAPNWQNISAKYLNDSTGQSQLAFIYGVHKNIHIPLDSIAVLNEKAFHQSDEKLLKEKYWSEEIGISGLQIYYVIYPFNNKSYHLLSLLYDSQNKLLAILPSISFDKEVSSIVGGFFERYRKYKDQ